MFLSVVCAAVNQHLTCGFSKVEFRWEVEARSLFLENFHIGEVQLPCLCCGAVEGGEVGFGDFGSSIFK